MNELQLDPQLVAPLASLETHRVEFVLIGDVANAIYNHGGVVSGVAIVPANYGRNVERLAASLNGLNASLGIAGRPDPRGLDWRAMDLRELAPCSFMTAYADIDIDFQPAGTNGYRDLFQDADRFEVAPGARPYVVSVDDLDRIGHAGASPQPPASLSQYAPPEPPDASPSSAPSVPFSFPASPPPTSPPPATLPPNADEHDLGIWTEEEFRAIRAGRITF